MTEDKARKSAIRARMAKTGESYTAARRHIVKAKEQSTPWQVCLLYTSPSPRDRS